MGSGVAWQRLLSGGASMVPGGGICSLLPDGSARLSPEGGANPTECAGGVAPFPGSLSGLGQWSP